MKQTCFNCKQYWYYDFYLCALEEPEFDTVPSGYVPDAIIDNDFTGCDKWEWNGKSDGEPSEFGM